MVSRPERGSSFLSRKSGDGLFRSRTSSRYSSVLHAPPEPTGWRARLAARSRVTNLGIFLLICFAIGSLFLNFRHWTSRPPAIVASSNKPKQPTVGDSVQGLAPEPAPGTENLEHLIIVVGQAVWAGTSFDGHDSDTNWVLEDHQKGGPVKTYWKQLERGIKLANKDPNSLLVLSGGQTRPHSPATEAESYFELALKSPLDVPVLPGARVVLKTSGQNGAQVEQFLDADHDGTGEKAAKPYGAQVVAPTSAHVPAPALSGTNGSGTASLRMTTETYALDTYENLVYSIARFREVTNHYPQRITVVGYDLHRERFERLHAKAVRWPLKDMYGPHKRWYYIGYDDEGTTDEMYRHEKETELHYFDKDMYGCHGILSAKRQSRNPTRRFPPYITSAPEMAGLLDHCPPNGVGLQGVYPRTLPWDLRVDDQESVDVDGVVLPEGGVGRGWWPDNRRLVLSRERD